MDDLNKYEAMIKKTAKKWDQTSNVTLLEAVRKILNATDKWRRKHPNSEVVQEILESIFFLLSTCAKLDHNVDLDSLFKQICDSKKTFSFEGVPKDLVWSFIMFSTEPHVDYSHRREPTAM